MPTSAAIVLIWVVRAVCGLLCWLAISVGQAMVALATAVRVCGRASASLAPLALLAQLVLLLAWTNRARLRGNSYGFRSLRYQRTSVPDGKFSTLPTSS